MTENKAYGYIRTDVNSLTNMNFAQVDSIVYKNTPHKYNIAFRSATAIRDTTEIVISFTNVTLPTGDQFFCTIDKTAPLDSNGLPDIDGIGCAEGSSSTELKITNLGAVAASTDFNIVISLISDKSDPGI